MANKMLIDASHPEETRVVVVRGSKVEEFDFESASRRPLRGNIYLAKVTRVEPSLQAAFVEYGGNRHGFLAFSEIHPDYYQIPVADRQALLAEQARYEEDAEGESEQRERGRNRRRRRGGKDKRAAGDAKVSAPVLDENGDPVPVSEAEAQAADEVGNDEAAESAEQDNERDEGAESDGDGENNGSENGEDERPQPEMMGGGDALDDVPDRPRFQSRRQYKIQEVIKRRQILLVQVVKEERGNKGAALTTFLSLAGRYSVLMPNTGRGGGISRKITSAEDRKRLKEIAGELEVPDGMGIILRTAGASRTKAEIKRDYEYLMRMWESVRELTLNSSAPALVYEEGSLIKRSIRDLYNKDIDDIMVAGDGGYREAKDFMKMLMPSHAKSIKPYREAQPLFAKFGVESQLDAMFSTQVTLKSGGYIVINQTEALVSIDVNSGRSTREHNIEDTALKTNLEAAEEVARQLRLRDLAGLIVIDFIDMEERRNNRSVEKKLKDCLKNDRARIQVGHISAFGLMEMSRQRIRTGVLESSSVKCAHCDGTGFVRSTPSVALQILRAVEEFLIRSSTHNLIVKTRTEVALYVLNQKRGHLTDLEAQFGVSVTLAVDDHLMGSTIYVLERGEFVQAEPRAPITGVRIEAVEVEDEDEDVAVEADNDEAEDEADRAASGSDEDRGTREERERNDDSEAGRRRRRRRRRRGRGGEREFGAERPNGVAQSGNDAGEDEAADPTGETDGDAAPSERAADGEERGGRPGRRRGRRGGRRTREQIAADDAADAAAGEAPALVEEPVTEAVVEAGSEPEPEAAPAEKPKRSRSRKKVADAVVEAPAFAESAAMDEPVAEPPAPAPEPEPVAPPVPEPEPVAIVLSEVDPNRPKRGGWWSRR
ncbi:MAG: ribonuclease E/G [Hyphomicrobiales bacterium]|nr:ribonuclease E/G [Hyphomicrobiales bacterium]